MKRMITAIVTSAALVMLTAAPVLASDLGTQSASQCGSGAVCAWSDVNFNGSVITTTSCSQSGVTTSLARISTGRSFYNRRTVGHLSIKNGSTTVATLVAGDSISSLTGGATSIICYTN